MQQRQWGSKSAKALLHLRSPLVALWLYYFISVSSLSSFCRVFVFLASFRKPSSTRTNYISFWLFLELVLCLVYSRPCFLFLLSFLVYHFVSCLTCCRHDWQVSAFQTPSQGLGWPNRGRMVQVLLRSRTVGQNTYTKVDRFDLHPATSRRADAAAGCVLDPACL